MMSGDKAWSCNFNQKLHLSANGTLLARISQRVNMGTVLDLENMAVGVHND
jgi:hypothetical protein